MYKKLFILLFVVLAVALVLSTFVASAQSDNAVDKTAALSDQGEKGSATEQAFVLRLNEKGETICRLATPAERSRIMKRGGESRLIYAGAPRAGDKVENGANADLPNLQPSAGLRIVLHGTATLEQNQTAKSAFITAANHWEALLSTPVTIVLDVDFGPSFFGTPYPSSDIIGATGSAEKTHLFSEVRDRLIANSPSAAESVLYNALPVGSVPTELSSAPFRSLTVRMTQANERALGFVPDISNPAAVPLGGGDAGIGFNSAFPFDFNPNNGVDSDKIDFDSVATHEIGHALGFISESGGAVYAPPSVWDLLRFRSGAASIGTLATAQRIMSSGGTQVYFNNQTNTFGSTELRLSTGGPNGDAGDGNQSSHWKDDGPSFDYIGIMDPNIALGERSPMTDNDVKAIDSFGYSTAASVPGPPAPPAPPPSSPPNDNFTNAMVIQDLAGATVANSTGGTKEAGEPAMLPGNSGGVGGRSVWFRWTSPVNGIALFDTEGSAYDTILAVSTGNSVGGLTRLTQNDDLAPGEATSSRVSFTVTAGVTYQLVVDGFDNGGGAEFGLIELNWSVTGTTPTPCTTQFSNLATITVNDSPTPPVPATPYPSNITVAGLSGTIAKLTLTLNGLTHSFPDDLDILLVGPQGQTLIVLSDVGGSTDTSVSLTLDDSASSTLPDGGAFVSGIFRPSNVGGGDVFPAPAPPGPYNSTAPQAANTLSSVFNGTNPNGTWKLYVVDDEDLDVGSISSGWSLSITTTPCALPTVQLDASNYTSAESIGSKTVTVTRAGDTSGASTVNYTTSDLAAGNNCNAANTGNASSRCDYETTAGTLRFAAGETSKTISIPIVDDAYAEGNENFTVALSNPSAATLGSPSSSSVTINDNDAVNGANPIDTANFFVRLHYIDFLNREPDAAGLAFWTNQITECEQPGATCSTEVRRINASAAFFLSIEFQETGYLVYRFYKSAYGNLAGLPVPLRLAEFLPDTQQIGKDVVIGQPGADQQLENNKIAFALDFVSRTRFTSSYPTALTPAQFVDALFANGAVTPSAADRNAAISEFNGAGNTASTAARARALRLIAENSILKQQETNKAFVLMQYFGYLRRNPDDPPEPGLNFNGYNFWLGKLNEFNGNFVNAEMVKAFIISSEYRARFGP